MSTQKRSYCIKQDKVQRIIDIEQIFESSALFAVVHKHKGQGENHEPLEVDVQKRLCKITCRKNCIKAEEGAECAEKLNYRIGHAY